MEIQIDNKIIVPNLLLHLKSKTKESVTIKITNEGIKIQSSSDYILDSFIETEVDKSIVGSMVSFILNSSVNLLSTGDGRTTIIFQDKESLILKQEDISIPYDISYEERVDIDTLSMVKTGKMSIKDLFYINKGYKSLSSMTKILENTMPPVMITSGSYCCKFADTILLDSAPIVFPDIELPYSTFNNIIKCLSGYNLDVYTDLNKNLLYLEMSNGNSVTVTYRKPNADLFFAIKSKIDDLTFIGDYKLAYLYRLNSLYKYFPKDTITLTMYEDGHIGALFHLMDGKTIQAGINSNSVTSSINISTAQFDAIVKTFKDYTTLQVYGGRDVLCLKGTGSKTLLLSGMTF